MFCADCGDCRVIPTLDSSSDQEDGDVFLVKKRKIDCFAFCIDDCGVVFCADCGDC